MRVWIVLSAKDREELQSICGCFEGVYASKEAAERATDRFGAPQLIEEMTDDEGAYQAYYQVCGGWVKVFSDEVGE